MNYGPNAPADFRSLLPSSVLRQWLLGTWLLLGACMASLLPSSADAACTVFSTQNDPTHERVNGVCATQAEALAECKVKKNSYGFEGNCSIGIYPEAEAGWLCKSGPNDFYHCTAGFILLTYWFPIYYGTGQPVPPCKDCNPVHDPIVPSDGSMVHQESDVSVGASIPFTRYFNSAILDTRDLAAGWRHSYQQKIEVSYGLTYRPYVPPQTLNVQGNGLNSYTYSTPDVACTDGFGSVKPWVPGWGGLAASYVNGLCKLSQGGQVINWMPLHVSFAGEGVAPPFVTEMYKKMNKLPVGTPTYKFLELMREDGELVRFVSESGGPFKPPAGVTMSVVETPSGFQVTDKSDTLETYDTTGKLLQIRERSGVTKTLVYDAADKLVGVTDSFGQTLSLGYDAQNRLTSVTDSGSHTTTYRYDSNGRIDLVTHPDATTRGYVYENTNFPKLITGLIDENNVRYSTWVYDSRGRVTSTYEAGNVGLGTLVYNSDGSVKDTDALGAVRTFAFTRVGQRLLPISISGSQCPTCREGKATTYHTSGFVTTRTDYNNNVTQYAFDTARGLELARTEAFGTPRARTISTQWHPNFRLPTYITETGRQTAFSYDSNGNMTSRTLLDSATSKSSTWTYTYNGLGQVLTADGPRTDVSDVTAYTYYNCATGAECGRVHTVTNPLGATVTYLTYNAAGQPLTLSDANGIVTTLSYDARGRVTSSTVGAETTLYQYWPTGLVRKVTLPDSTFIQYGYDAAHRLISVTDSDGNRMAYTLDGLGNRTKEEAFDPSNALALVRNRVFNQLSQLSKDIGAANTVSVTTTFGYDSNGNQTTVSAPLARNTTNAYDELNRLKQTTDPAGGITQYGYNALDQLVSVTDPRGLQTSYTYNALGELTQLVSPDTGTTTTTHDNAGNVLTSTDARNVTSSFVYDALNRVTQVSTPDRTVNFGYDTGAHAQGRLTSASDAGHSLSWSYDAQGRLLSKTQSSGAVPKTLGYGYTNGNLTSITTPSNNAVTYGYTHGKVTSVSVNGTPVISNVLYDPFGPARSWAWGSGALFVRTADTDGKVTQLDSAGLNTYTYDDAFRMTGIADAANALRTASYRYDLMDRLTSYDLPNATAGSGSPTLSVGATSVVAGQSISVTASGVIPAGAWLALRIVGSPSTSYVKAMGINVRYGPTTWTTPTPLLAGTYEVQLYGGGAFSVLATSAPITVTAPPAPTQATVVANAGSIAPSGSLFARLTGGGGAYQDWLALSLVGSANTSYIQYVYVPTGQTTKDWTLTVPSTPGTYEIRYYRAGGYTLAARSAPIVVSSSAPSLPSALPYLQSWTYDADGNRLTQTDAAVSSYALPATSNRLTSVAGPLAKTYGYDSMGNTLSDGTRTFAYNGSGRMSSSTSAGITTTYAYNALGQRIKKSNPVGTTYFFYDEAGHLVGEYDQNGNLIQELVWLGDIPIATIRTDQGGSGVGVFYIHTDHLNAPTKITRPADNQVIWRWDHDPFGNGAPNEDPDGNGLLLTMNLRYPGQYFDQETGLYYNYFRDYDPETGRYRQSDPIGLAAGVNTYAYVDGNPVSNSDSSGLINDNGWRTGLPAQYQDGMQDKAQEMTSDPCGCFAKAFGIESLLGGSMVAVGQPTRAKPFVQPGTSPGTSPASEILSQKFPQRLPFRVPAPTAMNPGAMSNIVGRIFGRWVPWIGWGLLAHDAKQLESCLEECKDKACK